MIAFHFLECSPETARSEGRKWVHPSAICSFMSLHFPSTSLQARNTIPAQRLITACEFGGGGGDFPRCWALIENFLLCFCSCSRGSQQQHIAKAGLTSCCGEKRMSLGKCLASQDWFCKPGLKDSPLPVQVCGKPTFGVSMKGNTSSEVRDWGDYLQPLSRTKPLPCAEHSTILSSPDDTGCSAFQSSYPNKKINTRVQFFSHLVNGKFKLCHRGC